MLLLTQSLTAVGFCRAGVLSPPAAVGPYAVDPDSPECRHQRRRATLTMAYRRAVSVVIVSVCRVLRGLSVARSVASQQRRERERYLRERARTSRAKPVEQLEEAEPTVAVWRSRDLPATRTAAMGVPLSEGVSSVFIGAVAYVPVALVTSYAPWNYAVAAVLVVTLSYGLCSRRVVVGPDFVAVRKFGPYRLARAASICSGALAPSQRGGVLTVRTGDGRTMRLRRVEFTNPQVNAALRALLLTSGRKYDAGLMRQLDLPWREDFGHHRYLLDAVQ